MKLQHIAEELSHFTFSKPNSSFRWNTHDKKLKEALELLQRAEKKLPDGRSKRRVIAAISTITNLLEARAEQNSDVLSHITPNQLQEELLTIGRELLHSRAPARVTRRQFLRMAGIAAAGALATGTIIATLEPQKSFLARLFERRRIKRGYYFQLGAYSTLENAAKAADELSSKCNALTPFRIVYLPETEGPYKVFIKQSFQTFDDAVSVAQLIHATYPSLEFGIVRIDENGERHWLSTFAHETKKRFQQLEQTMRIQGLAGFTPQQRRYYPLIQEACERYPPRNGEMVNPLLVLAMMGVESSYNPHSHSPKGAMGLLQLMPRMWKYFHEKSPRYHGERALHHECNPYDPEQNIDAGVHMISYLYKKYPPTTPDREGTIIMAYNTGETNLRKGIISKETREYLQKVRAAKARIMEKIGG